MSAPRIAIVGDGLLPALAAVTLSHRLGRGDTITVVPAGRGLDGLGPFGRIVAALPDWRRSPAIAALPPELLTRTAAASFSLGIAYAGWGPAGWFLPFGDSGAALGGVAFHHLLARERQAGRAARLADYSLAALAAQAERFAFPGDDPRSPLATLAFGQHFDGAALAAALARVAGGRGVRAAPAPLAQVERDDDGIAALLLADGNRVAADLFLDCTGPAALLAGDARFESWRRWLPCDRVVAIIVEDAAPPPPYALCAATATGWQADTPVSGARGIATFFAREAPSDAAACESGLRRDAWRGNCVAIGASGGLVEPVAGTPLLLAQAALDRLARLLPAPGGPGVEAKEFNRLHASSHERARDVAIALHATRGTIPADDLPEAVARKLATFASRGIVPIEDDEPFEAADWIALLDGQGVRARRIDPLAAAIPDTAIAAHLARLRERLIATLRTMPTHAAVLDTMGQQR